MNAKGRLIFNIVSLFILIALISGCVQQPQSTPVSQSQQPQAAAVKATTAPVKMEPTATVVQPASTAPTQPPAAATETSSTTTNQVLIPLQPGQVSDSVPDVDTSKGAVTRTCPAGDEYDINIYERPFSQNVMDYRPDLDITKGEISQDSNFIYVSEYLNNINPKTNGLQGMYGVELDTDLDGRGNFLIMGNNPNTSDWQKAIVTAYQDSGLKVGGPRPELSDAPQTYSGYDKSIFPGQMPIDPNSAWIRVSPDSKSVVQIAFKPSLIGSDVQFLWRVWTDDGPKNVQQYDYNDHYTLKQAGSPYKTDPNYPVKALYQIDNTCWGLYNILAAPKNIQGLCCSAKLPENPNPGAGTISVLVFGDTNGNGLHEADETGSCKDVTVTLSNGTCATATNPGSTTVSLDKNCQYNSKAIKMGKYCLSAKGATFTTPVNWDITLSENCPGCDHFDAYFGVNATP
jgi:hypothetical protein